MIGGLAAVLRVVVVVLAATIMVRAAPADQHELCDEWALRGECEANPNYMLVSCATACGKLSQDKQALKAQVAHIDSFFDLSAPDLDGYPVDFAQFRNQITILTNVATYCGRTDSHYKGLVRLYARFQDDTTNNVPVNILAFPCNQFGEQEPGSAAEIKQFAADLGVTFRMMQKVDVNGDGASLVYKFLKYHADVDLIQWNFDTYFLVDGRGNIQALSDVHPRHLWEPVQKLVHGGGGEEL